VVSQPNADYFVRLLLTDLTGQTVDIGTFLPTNTWHPTNVWEPGQAWRGQTNFRLPIQAQAGEALLSVQLVDSGGAAQGAPVGLTTLQVLSTTRVFIPPQPQVSRPANFGNKIALLGADLNPDLPLPGGVLQITLYWQALVEMDVPYSVFVHLLGADERVVAGHDGQPMDGTRSTIGWVPGEYVTDLHEILLPTDLPPGEYVVEVGLYDAGVSGMPRLWILGEGGQVEIDRVIFGPVLVK
jgi:hypothetical protein